MRENEYTAEVLRAFRTRFVHVNRSEALNDEDVTQMVNRLALSEDDVCILISLPGARKFSLRSHLVRYISEILEENRDPKSALPLLLHVINEPDGTNECDMWKVTGQLLGQNRDKEMIFPFLQLPREIRSQIYLHYIHAFEPHNPSPRDLLLEVSRKITAYRSDKPPNRLALLRVSRQIHDEGTKDLFDNFVVEVGNIGLLHRLLNTFSETTKSLIRYMDIYDISVKQTGALAFRLSDRNLNSIRVLRIGSIPTFSGPLYFRDHRSISEKYNKWPKYDDKLAAAVHQLFGRNTITNFTPTLELYGFDSEQIADVTFPERWVVAITAKDRGSSAAP